MTYFYLSDLSKMGGTYVTTNNIIKKGIFSTTVKGKLVLNGKVAEATFELYRGGSGRVIDIPDADMREFFFDQHMRMMQDDDYSTNFVKRELYTLFACTLLIIDYGVLIYCVWKEAGLLAILLCLVCIIFSDLAYFAVRRM